jgi:DNA-directed RNA polymerase specialized sigma subunit
MRHGPSLDYAMTHAEIGAVLGLSRTMVQLIENRALAKVAAALGLPPPTR